MPAPKLYQSQSFPDLAQDYNDAQDFYESNGITTAHVEDLVESIIHVDYLDPLDKHYAATYGDDSGPVVQTFRSNLWE